MRKKVSSRWFEQETDKMKSRCTQPRETQILEPRTQDSGELSLGDTPDPRTPWSFQKGASPVDNSSLPHFIPKPFQSWCLIQGCS